MTLEDFFTLTEMKDGLASLSRVEELVSLMQQQKDYAKKNLGDAARQWSTVASILAATENSECLDHFVQQNGLWFLDQWLQEAQRCNGDKTDSFIEESIKALLGAVEKLPVVKERSIASGIGITVKQLCGHRCLEIQERAKALFETWNKLEGTDRKLTVEGGCSGSLVPNVPPKRTVSERTHVTWSANSGSDDSSVQDGKVPKTNQEIPQTTLDQATASGLPVSGHGSCSITEKASQCFPEGMASSGACASLVPRERNSDKKAAEISEKVLGDAGKGVEMDTRKGAPCKSSEREACTVSVIESITSCNIDAKMRESSPKKTASKEGIQEPKPKNGEDDGLVKQDSSVHNCKPKKPAPIEASLQGIEAPGTVCDGQEIVNGTTFSEISRESSLIDIEQSGAVKLKIDQRDSEMETVLGYEEDDALEVARQVAKEVEREVESYREEPLCSSSSEKNAKDEHMQASSPDSIQGKPMMEQNDKNGTSIEPDAQDGGPSPNEETRSRVSNGNGTKHKDLEFSQLMALTQEAIVESDRGRCSFDLNEDIQTEEGECPPFPFSNHRTNLSAPIPVVAAPKGAPELPVTPLQFQGELGWRGSAATSAFRPASPRRTPDGDKTFVVETSKQKQNILKIDLNVAEGDDNDEAALDLISVKHVPVSLSLPFGDDSVEVTSRAERLKLDLNRLGDNEDGPDWRVEGGSHLYQNGNSSPSPSSSSSSRQPSMRDIDLNDNPSFFDTFGPHNHQTKHGKSPSQHINTYGGFKLDDPIVSIMGSRVEVERIEFANPTQSFLVNGHGGTFSAMARVQGAGGTQPVLAYTAPSHPPFGYNGLGMGPTMSLPQAVYGPGPVPYMVDSRGATVIPQILGSPAAVSSSFSRPSFIMSMTGGASSGAKGVGRASLDLNSGIASTESTSRELRQLFIQGHGGLMEDKVKSGSQIAGSGVTLKRKEPEYGWEPYPVEYKQTASWHQSPA